MTERTPDGWGLSLAALLLILTLIGFGAAVAHVSCVSP